MSNADPELRLLSALGLAMKAGKVRSGELAAEKALKSGKAALAVLDSGASASTQKRWADACAYAGVPLITVGGVGRAIGREAHMIACIADIGFAQMILRAHKDIDS